MFFNRKFHVQRVYNGLLMGNNHYNALWEFAADRAYKVDGRHIVQMTG